MKVEIQIPPDATLLSSMLYEGFLTIVSRCTTEVDETCLKNLLIELKNKSVNFIFTGNDIKHTLKSISAEHNVNVKTFSDLFDLFLKTPMNSLVITSRVVKTKKGVVIRVGNPDFVKGDKEGYSFQIMKVDRYMGISSLDYGMFNEQVTNYADLAGLLMFFIGLASSYVASPRGTKSYYFLFFDTETLLSHVLKDAGNVRNWMDIKNDLQEALREAIEESGDIIDEAMALSVIYNSRLVEELYNGMVSYVGFRLVKVSVEGNTYKIYDDMPLRASFKMWLGESLESAKRMIEEIANITQILIPAASKFIKGSDKYGDGYHALKGLKYLYLYQTTGDPSYLTTMYRELHEAYNTCSRKGDMGAERYLKCFLNRLKGS
ncbi:MAG: hypothetical protein QW196_01140 [Sulfolobales archaeon]